MKIRHTLAALLCVVAFAPIASAQVTPVTRGGTGLSTAPTNGYVLVGNANGGYTLRATSTLGISAGGGSGTVTSVGFSVPTGFSISNSPVTTSGTLGLTYATGYSPFITASGTAWQSFYTTPSGRITAGNHIDWTANTLDVVTTGDWTGTLDTYNAADLLARAAHTGTQLAATISDFVATVRASISETITGIDYGSGVFSLTSGYNIPLTASTTNWQTAFSWGNHALQGYLTGNQTITLSGDASGSGTTGITVAVANDSHDHTGSTLSGVDISSDTNLAGDSEVVLTGDSLSLAASVARDSELHAAVTVSGARDYFTLSGQDLVRGVIDVSDDTNLTVSATGLNLTADALALTAGYQIPLSASTTAWQAFYAAPSARITDGTGLTWTSNTLNCDTAAGNAQGCLTSTHWTKFDNKVGSTSIDTSTELDTLVSDDTGSGSLVFATSPTIVTPTIAKLANLTSNGFVKTSAGDGTLSVDTNTYLTANQTITLSGDVAGSGTTGITTTIGADKVLESMLKAVNGPTDEYVLTYESTTGDFEWEEDQTGVGGGGITSLNGQTASSQSFASSTSGTDFKVTSASDIHTFQVPSASATARGLLTSANWTTFNEKVSSSSINSLAEIETLTGVSNLIIEADIDASSELAALMDDETGTGGALVFASGPTLTGTTLFSAASGTRATTSVLTVTGLTSALTLTGASGIMAEYAGTSCTNQFVRSLSALGVATCASIGTSDITDGSIVEADLNLNTNTPGRVLQASSTATGGWAWVATSSLGIAGGTSQWSDVSGGINYASGRVGIASSTPKATLAVVGTPGTDIFRVASSTNAEFLKITPTGNTFIGNGSNPNVNPNIRLLVQDATDARMGVAVNNAGVFQSSGDANTYGALFAYKYGSGAINLALNQFGGNVGISSTSPSRRLTVAGSGFFGGNLTATGTLNVTGLTSALTLTGATGDFAEYAGATCTNQVVEDISALGASTCVSINNTYWSGTDLSVANGGTGLSTFGGTNHILYTTAADTLSSEAAFAYDASTNALTAGSLTLTTDLTVANGGTGLSTFGGTNHALYTTAADTLASEAAYTYNPSTDTLTSVNLSVGTTLSFSGVGALNGVDSVDSTTITTIENAFDTVSAALETAIEAAIDTITSLAVSTTLIIPFGATCDSNADGEICQDTTDNQLVVDGAVVPTTGVRIWGATFASTSPAFISGGLLPAPNFLDGYTITRIQCYVLGGTSKVIAIEDASANSSEDITCATTNTTDDGSITNATYTASELQSIDFGATTGAVNYVSISVFGNWTAE